MKFMTRNTVNALPGYNKSLLDFDARRTEKNLAAEADAAGREMAQMVSQLDDSQKTDINTIKNIADTLISKGYRQEAVQAAAKINIEYAKALQQQEQFNWQKKDRGDQQQLLNQTRTDQNAAKQLMLNGGTPQAVNDDYGRGPEAVTSDLKNMMSYPGLLKYKQDKQADESFDLNKKLLNAKIDNYKTPKDNSTSAMKDYKFAKANGYPGSFVQYQSDIKNKTNKPLEKLKYIQKALELSTGGDEATTKASAATEFDAITEGWEQIPSSKPNATGWIKPDGTAVDALGRPIKKKTPQAPQPGNNAPPTPLHIKSTPEKIKEKYGDGQYGKRADGTPKGRGYFGELKTPDGDVATEISIGIGIDGDEVEIPLLVPTLTHKEVKTLLDGGQIPQEIIDKAIAHAKKRMAEGKSPFAEEDDKIKTFPMLEVWKDSIKPGSTQRRLERDKNTFLKKPPIPKG